MVGTAGTEAGLEVVKQAGADYVLNHREEDHLRKAFEISDGKGFDVLLENMAHINLGNDLRVLSQKARLAVVFPPMPCHELFYSIVFSLNLFLFLRLWVQEMKLK